MHIHAFARFIYAALTVAAAAFAADQTAAHAADSSSGRNHTPRMSYIENGDIRLGIDLNLGGAITYLAPTTNKELNVINSHDWGRQVQLSYYSGPTPFHPAGTTMSTNWSFLGWNPIQSGDCFGFKSQVLQHTNDGRSLFVKCIPMQWPLKNVPGECGCEVWLELAGPSVKARCRLTNHRSDPTQYRARDQELPAVYVNGPFHRLMTYRGDKPFTGGALSRIEGRLDKDGHWAQWMATENWAAEVNEAGWGLGVWNPDAPEMNGGFAGKPGVGGPLDNPTGYIAPRRTEILDHNIVYEYRYELILGTLDEIRAHVYRRATRPQPRVFRFERDRQGWHYANVTDAGWPIRGELDVQLQGKNPQVLSPALFRSAEEVSRLTLEAAFENTGTEGRLYWRKLDQRGFSAEQSVRFSVVPDGQFHRIEVGLSGSTAWNGAIVQLRLDPAMLGSQAGRLRLKSVALTR